jgi:hypothetical protein
VLDLPHFPEAPFADDVFILKRFLRGFGIGFELPGVLLAEVDNVPGAALLPKDVGNELVLFVEGRKIVTQFWVHHGLFKQAAFVFVLSLMV